ncbi:MAG: hypothetical protein RLZZ303_2023 [Candidatus Hydrogenedentota bacterium]|jgi:excisionase family DNA binding protein
MDKILTVEQVAEALQVKAITVREMFRDKRIRGFKVGKAWRTTEKMLQEDIEAIARGESPADLPMLGTETAAREVEVPKRGRKHLDGRPPAKPASKKSATKTPKPEPAPEAANAATEPSKPKRAPRKPAEDDDADSQQLLF